MGADINLGNGNNAGEMSENMVVEQRRGEELDLLKTRFNEGSNFENEFGTWKVTTILEEGKMVKGGQKVEVVLARSGIYSHMNRFGDSFRISRVSVNENVLFEEGEGEYDDFTGHLICQDPEDAENPNNKGLVFKHDIIGLTSQRDFAGLVVSRLKDGDDLAIFEHELCHNLQPIRSRFKMIDDYRTFYQWWESRVVAESLLAQDENGLYTLEELNRLQQQANFQVGEKEMEIVWRILREERRADMLLLDRAGEFALGGKDIYGGEGGLIRLKSFLTTNLLTYFSTAGLLGAKKYIDQRDMNEFINFQVESKA